MVFYNLCTGNGAQYGTSVVLNMPLTTQIVFEFFLAILANIVGLFGMHVPYMLSHVIFKINLFSTNQTFKSGFSIIVKNFLIFCLHFQDILFVCSYTCNNLNIKFFQAGRSKRKLKNSIWEICLFVYLDAFKEGMQQNWSRIGSNVTYACSSLTKQILFGNCPEHTNKQKNSMHVYLKTERRNMLA